MLNRTVVSVVTQDDEEVEKPMAKTTNICVSSFARFLSHVSVVVVVVVVAGGGGVCVMRVVPGSSDSTTPARGIS